MQESEIIRSLQTKCPSNSDVLLGIGDDAAVLNPERKPDLVCKDMLLGGVHFLIEDTEAKWIGHKALGVNLSDIAAMGGTASSAYVGLALPRRLSSDSFLDSLYQGINELADRFGVAIAGGDTNIWDGPFVISLTVLGHSHSRGPICRSGARAGDFIYVSGPLGDSYASGHHLHFIPRLAEAKRLMDQFAIHSMIDLSDGLAKDLRLMAAQSGLRACLDPQAIPLRSSLHSLDRAHGLARALSDGEDFELCFTASPEDAERLSQMVDLPLYKIGFMQEGHGMVWEDPNGTFQLIEAMGYEHR